MKNTLHTYLFIFALTLGLNGAQPMVDAYNATPGQMNAVSTGIDNAALLPQPEPPPPTCVGCGAKASANGSISHKSNCPYAPKK